MSNGHIPRSMSPMSEKPIFNVKMVRKALWKASFLLAKTVEPLAIV